MPGIKISPTVPSVTINNKYLRAGLLGRAYTPKGLGKDHSWHSSNLSPMKLDKSAEAISKETKHELIATGVIGAAGAVTSGLAHKVMSKGLVRNTAGRAALLGGGLGLLGDYAAVKLNKKVADDSSDVRKQEHKMGKIASILRDHANEVRQSSPELMAVEHLKQAGMKEEDARVAVAQEVMEKKAFEELTYRGIDAEEAVRLVKAANINVKDLQNTPDLSSEENLADLLEKVAEYIDAKEAENEALLGLVESMRSDIGSLEKAASEVAVAVAEPALPEQITKLAGVGALTFDDIEALKAVPSETLTKVASAMEQPWEMGKAAGLSNRTGDPFLDFCLG